MPHDATPAGGPLDGRRERVGPPEAGRRRSRRTPLACARAWRSTQAAADGDSPLHPAVPARDPPSPAPWLASRSTCENARVIATTQPRSWPGVAAERLGDLTWRLSTRLWLTARRMTRGSASDAESGADDCALQRESGWHAGGEVLGTSNPGDCPYDPDDCPSIEVVESETGWRRRPCVRRNPRTACPRAVSRTTACVPREAWRFRDAAVAECAFPSRRGAREVWGDPPRQAAGHYGECLNWADALEQPPARLRGGLRGGPQISAWRRTSRKGAFWGSHPHGKTHFGCVPSRKTALCASDLTERRSVCGCPHTECAFW